VLLAYLDESQTETAFYVTALVVRDAQAIQLTTALDGVIEYAQDTYGRVATRAELHGYPLAQGTDDWARLKSDIPARMDIFNRAIQAIASHDVMVCIRGVEIAGFQRRYGTDAADIHGAALAFVLERVQWAARDAPDVALVIADEVRGREARYRRALRDYQQTGTFGWRAQKLDRIADTLYFAPSSESRLLQAADLVSYAHVRSLRKYNDARVQAFHDGLWDKLHGAGRVREASLWVPP
jgi:Protein of unknown function (DUF3800)